MAANAPQTPKGAGTAHAPYTDNSNVKDGDLRILTLVGVAAMSVMIIFGAGMYYSGLLHFPSIPQNPDQRDYLNDTLVYRERRMAMALVMRTFLTGFSFVVGLALCTMGGLFILRQVTSLTSLSGNIPGKGGIGARLMQADDATPREVADRLKQMQFSFASYSPGVLFMVGGVAIMVVTQLLAIPVKAVEIVPRGAASLCENPQSGNFITCSSNVATPSGEDEAAGLLTEVDDMDMAGIGRSIASDDDADVAFADDVGDFTDEDLFATSSAVVEQAPPEVMFELAFMQPSALDQLELPDGFAFAGISPEAILIEGDGLTFTFYAYELDFAAPDWGIVLPFTPDVEPSD